MILECKIGLEVRLITLILSHDNTKARTYIHNLTIKALAQEIFKVALANNLYSTYVVLDLDIEDYFLYDHSIGLAPRNTTILEVDLISLISAPYLQSLGPTTD